MLLSVILILLFLMFIALLWMPIVLYINTTKNQYYVQIIGLAKVTVEPQKKGAIKNKFEDPFFKFLLLSI
jgi:hypothetical protein